MSWNSRRLRMTRWMLVPLVGSVTAAGLLVALPTSGAPDEEPFFREQALPTLSQGAAVNYLLTHPDQAPPALRERFLAFRNGAPPATTAAPSGSNQAFNHDFDGVPQNEESVTACRNRPSTVLGGTNDFRGLDPEQGTVGTGWHLSTNGGDSVANEGLLPEFTPFGRRLPAIGDPVVAADQTCRLFAVSLNANFVATPENPLSAVSLYRSDAATLTSCGGGSDPSCWPKRRLVAVGARDHFLDKPWFDVGVSGGAGEVVWVAYTDFSFDPDTFEETATIKAVRCDPGLVNCSAPVALTGGSAIVQFSDVTIGADGRTYVTWTELNQATNAFTHKLRIAPAGSLAFGPTRVVAAESRPITFGAFLHANDFRVVTMPKNEVVVVGGRPRIFVVWESCRARVLDGFGCQEPEIKLRYSDNDGATWGQKILSRGGDNYFATIHENGAGRLAVAWFSSRYDGAFHNKQDLELTSVNAATLSATEPRRITPTSNEPEADPFLGGNFIGDYIEVFAHQGTAWVHYNANYRQVPFEGQGFPVPQQDNFLAKVNF